MRLHAYAAAVLVAISVGVAAGCGGTGQAEPDDPPPPPDGTGYFVGTDRAGLGAAVDLLGEDEVAARARVALDAAPPRSGDPRVIGVVSLVNTGGQPVPLPRFAAVLDGGEMLPLTAAHSPRSGVPDAADLFPAPPVLLAPGATATTYVVLAGATSEEVDHVRMAVRPGEPVRLAARRR